MDQKGVDRLIEALALVRASFPGAVLRVVGDGPERRALEALAEQLALGSPWNSSAHWPTIKLPGNIGIQRLRFAVDAGVTRAMPVCPSLRLKPLHLACRSWHQIWAAYGRNRRPEDGFAGRAGRPTRDCVRAIVTLFSNSKLHFARRERSCRRPGPFLVGCNRDWVRPFFSRLFSGLTEFLQSSEVISRSITTSSPMKSDPAPAGQRRARHCHVR